MTESAVVTDAGALSDLEAWRATLNAGSVHLWVNNFNPTKSSVLADFTEAGFTGYFPVSPPGFGAPFLNVQGKGEIDSSVLLWTFTAGGGSSLVYGWMILDALADQVLLFQKFLFPVSLTPGEPNLSRVIQIGAVSEQL